MTAIQEEEQICVGWGDMFIEITMKTPQRCYVIWECFYKSNPVAPGLGRACVFSQYELQKNRNVWQKSISGKVHDERVWPLPWRSSPGIRKVTQIISVDYYRRCPSYSVKPGREELALHLLAPVLRGGRIYTCCGFGSLWWNYGGRGWDLSFISIVGLESHGLFVSSKEWLTLRSW